MFLLPQPTSRIEKDRFIDIVKERLLKVYDEKIMAIGVYGSFALDEDGPYSDINFQVIVFDGQRIDDFQFIYPPFKVTIETLQKQQYITSAKEINSDWSLNVARFIHTMPIYDPIMFFSKMKSLPLQISSYEIKDVMKKCMIEELYVKMAKIRNLRLIQDETSLLLNAVEFCEQSAKLIGLANRYYFRSKTRMLEESLGIATKPHGYEQLVKLILQRDWDISENIYEACEHLWTGINQWFNELGINYRSHSFPF
ncbi:KNTase domain-containing protein [Cytobacillus kochii]|uniref:kanamycin nucleotidyltransferase C-terminal domain-containing protein n=1 Tax=Cytobacillus kochii TaxID=859143 RepID=UPI00384F0F10